MRAALAALIRGCLGPLALWCLFLGFAVLTALATAAAFAAGWGCAEHLRARQALEDTIANLAGKGEIVGLADRPPRPGSPASELAAPAAALRDLSRDFPIGRAWPRCRELLGDGTAKVGWRSDGAPSQRDGLTWGDVACQLEMAHEILEGVRGTLDNTATADKPGDEAADRAILPWLAWSAMDRLHELDTPGAVREIGRIRRLADRHRQETNLGSQLWRCAVMKGAIRLSWETLQAPSLDHGTLQMLQAVWAQDRPLDGIAATLRQERASGIRAFAAMIRSMERPANQATLSDALRAAIAENRDPAAWAGEAGAWLRYGAWRLLWANEEMACFLNALQIVIDHIEGDPGALAWVGVRDAWLQAESALAQRPSRMGLDRLVIGASGLNGGRAACQVILEYEAERRLLLTDIARSRYELDVGTTPESLGHLIPSYLTDVPRDPMDGEPFRYRLGPEGSPILYSVGPDCRDDNGDPRRPDSKPITALSHGRDIVWPAADFARSIE